MEFDLFIIPKILNSLRHPPDVELVGIIYLGCEINRLSFWDQIIGNL